MGTSLRLERNAWSLVRRLTQATNEYPPPFPRAGEGGNIAGEMKDVVGQTIVFIIYFETTTTTM